MFSFLESSNLLASAFAIFTKENPHRFNESDAIVETEDNKESNADNTTPVTAPKKKGKKGKKEKKAKKKTVKLKVKPLKKPKPSGPSRAVMAAINKKLVFIFCRQPNEILSFIFCCLKNCVIQPTINALGIIN